MNAETRDRHLAGVLMNASPVPASTVPRPLPASLAMTLVFV